MNERLKNIRESLGFDKKTFAKILNINPRTYENYEANRRCMNVNTLLHICSVLGITADFLTGKENYVTVKDFNVIIEIIRFKLYIQK